jgi:hypothetical protein
VTRTARSAARGHAKDIFALKKVWVSGRRFHQQSRWPRKTGAKPGHIAKKTKKKSNADTSASALGNRRNSSPFLRRRISRKIRHRQD